MASAPAPTKGAACVVLGLQWGDEGKGKLVDFLAQRMDIVARCAGGNNAGHTVSVVTGTKKIVYDFHLLPSGLAASPTCMSVIGNGVVIHVPGLFAEIANNEAKGLTDWADRLVVSDRAHIVLDTHQAVDGLQEEDRGAGKIGTTRRGIGPCYSEKAARSSVRVCDLVHNFPKAEALARAAAAAAAKRFPHAVLDIEREIAALKGYAERLRPLVIDTIAYVNDALDAGKAVLVEGANAAMLDIDFGSYPYVTSSSCTVGGACTGLGIPPSRIKEVYGVVKAYCTRVGEGGFPTELLDAAKNETAQCVSLRAIGHEYGVTTGRPRRCGWYDAVAVRYAVRINGVTGLCITKLDCLDTFDEINVGVAYHLDGKTLTSVPACIEDLSRLEVVYKTLPGWKQDITKIRRFEDLPENARKYVAFLEEASGALALWVGVGPDRDATIDVPPPAQREGAAA